MNWSLLQELIVMPKLITVQPGKNFKSENGHSRKEFECQSDNGRHTFRVFIRFNNEFPENFSVGLIYLQKMAVRNAQYLGAMVGMVRMSFGNTMTNFIYIPLSNQA